MTVLNKWEKRGNRYSYAVELESFDLAWEYMHFVAKLCRSHEVYPDITNSNKLVTIVLSKEKQDAGEFIKSIESYFEEDSATKAVSKTTKSTSVALFCDGGSRGNPGPSASGFVIYNSEGEEVDSGGEYLGVTTNNQAEYRSLKDGLTHALSIGATKVSIHMDSQLVVRQILGEYKVRNRDLWPIYESIMKLLERFNEYKIVHVPRELNKAADSMVNQILDDNVSV